MMTIEIWLIKFIYVQKSRSETNPLDDKTDDPRKSQKIFNYTHIKKDKI